MIVNDLYCPACGATQRDIWFNAGMEPKCDCGAQMRQDWSHGQPPATDLTGAPRKYDGLDGEYLSNRQAERAAQKRAQTWNESPEAQKVGMVWEDVRIAGDKKGGARDVRRKKNSAFSYEGKGSRVSTGERA